MIACTVYTSNGSLGVASILEENYSDADVEEISLREGRGVYQRYRRKIEERLGRKVDFLPSSKFRLSVKSLDDLATVQRNLIKSKIDYVGVSGGEVIMAGIRRRR